MSDQGTAIKYPKSIRFLSEHKQFHKIFNTFQICQEEKLELKKHPKVDAFKTFHINKLFRELYMPTKKPIGESENAEMLQDMKQYSKRSQS